jgi:hypothetical protein
LMRFGLFTQLDDFVSGREDRDNGPNEDGN